MESVFKVGDSVFDINYGKGSVSDIDLESSELPHLITVDFQNGETRSYTKDGKLDPYSNKTLSFTDYSGSQPFSQERPRPKIKEGQLIYVSLDGKMWCMRYFKEFCHSNGLPVCYRHQTRSGRAIIWPKYSLTNPLEEPTE